MNSLLLVGVSLFLFVIAYHFYGRFLERLWDVSPDRKTPAFEKGWR